MNRWIWAARIFGILLILVLFFMLSRMITTLRQMQDSQETSAPAR
jgi:hypothetical protein